MIGFAPPVSHAQSIDFATQPFAKRKVRPTAPLGTLGQWKAANASRMLSTRRRNLAKRRADKFASGRQNA